MELHWNGIGVAALAVVPSLLAKATPLRPDQVVPQADELVRRGPLGSSLLGWPGDPRIWAGCYGRARCRDQRGIAGRLHGRWLYQL